MKLSFFQAILLAVFGAAGVAGVLVFSLVLSGNAGEQITPVEIWGTFDERTVGAILEIISAEEPRLKSVTYVEKDGDTYLRDLTTALASDTGPDAFIVRNDAALAEAAKIQMIPYTSVSRESFQNTFVQAADPLLTPNGILGVPLVVDPLVLYWNRDYFATRGLAKPPEYWDEVFSIVEKLTVRTQTGSIEKSGIAFGEYQNVDHAKDILSLLMAQAGADIVSYDNKGNLRADLTGTVKGSNAGESALRFYTDFSNPIKNHYSWNRSFPSSRNAFAAGDLALYVGYASEEPVIRITNPNLNFAPAAIPQLRGGAREQTFAHTYALAVPLTSTNSHAALTTAYLLVSEPNSRVFASALGMASARRDVLSLPATGYDDLFNKQAILARAWVDPNPIETDEIFRVMIESIVVGSARFNEALNRAAGLLNQF